MQHGPTKNIHGIVTPMTKVIYSEINSLKISVKGHNCGGSNLGFPACTNCGQGGASSGDRGLRTPRIGRHRWIGEVWGWSWFIKSN